MARREYVGNAPATTLNGAITAVSTEIQITSGTNWPTGASFPFVVIIDRGLAAEEKALITSRTANTLFVNTRGFDSTTAASHANGATIEHGLSATDINEINDHTFDTTNDDHTQYLNTARHDVEARHTFTAALGTPTAPVGIGGVASAGSGNNPAREDHVHPGGQLGYAQVTANGSAISAETDITGLSTAVTVGTGRRVRISAEIGFDRTVADGLTRLRIQEGTTILVFRDGLVRAASEGAITLPASVVITPSAGAHTYKLVLERITGTGTTRVAAAATFPSYILVEDIGAA